ncbi:MAG: acetate--CoA ligase family protein [Methylococcales bacterium]
MSLRDAALKAAEPRLMRLLGPNCLGLIRPSAKLNATFSPASVKPGRVAFITQSGALDTAGLDWANGRQIGFSAFVSLDDSADVDFADVIDYLSSDPITHAILLYIESIQHARKFMSAARAAARNKPLIVVISGRWHPGGLAARSHTGALAGEDAVYDAAIRRAGMLRVYSLEDLFNAAESLSRGRIPTGDRVLIVTNGGGPGVLAADALEAAGGQLAELPEPLISALDKGLPAYWSRANPIDVIGDADLERYRKVTDILLANDSPDRILFMHAPTAVAPSELVAQELAPVFANTEKPLRGYRDRPPADCLALYRSLISLSQMVIELDDVIECDINPLLVDAEGAIALDARIRISASRRVPGARLAIHPVEHDVQQEDQQNEISY